MRTFSEIVDVAIATAKTPSHMPFAISSANAIVRELTSAYPNGWNRIEDYIPVEPERFSRTRQPLGKTVKWPIPLNFRQMEAVHYGERIPNGEFVPNREPGKVQEKSSAYWYQSSDTIIFSGAYGGIALSYFSLTKTFKYYVPDKRLLRSGLNDDYETRLSSEDPAWLPLSPFNSVHKARLDNHTNWVIRDHPHVVLEGLLARLFNVVGNRETGGRHFSQYTSDKQTINRANNLNLAGEL